MKGIPFLEIASTYVHALYLDTSWASYLLVIPFLLFVIYSFTGWKLALKIHTIYILLIVLIFALISVAELEIFNEWGTKINVKAINFLKHPPEVIHSTRTSFLFMGFIGVGILSFLGFLLHKKICPPFPYEKGIAGKFIFLFLIPGILLLGIRGGFQQIPIQQSDAYFSKYNILNLAAINSGWNLAQSIMENRRNLGENPYQYYPLAQARKTVDELYTIEKDTTVLVLKAKRPNVVLIVLEGWSADLIKSLGGYDSITPGLDSIIREGILFDNMYASGSLSDQGMTSVFSAFPAQPSVSIISQPGKYVHLPCITKEFTATGYATSFLFGGQLSYGNIKAYMYFNKFDKILEGKDFDDTISQGKLGVHDEFLYVRQLAELRNERVPFFGGMFTLSSHSPFDMPMDEKKKLSMGGDEQNYVNSVHYADEKLFQFLQNAKKEKWFANTLFIMISDHGHRSPKHWVMNQPEYRRIPMVWWGNVIKDEYKGYRNKKLCSQIDLASTLLHQLNLPAKEFEWSKNLFNPYTPEFAFFETTDGFGWVRPEGYIVYSHTLHQYYFEQTNSPSEKLKLEKEGKSYLQVMFQEYTDY